MDDTNSVQSLRSIYSFCTEERKATGSLNDVKDDLEHSKVTNS